MCLHLSELEFKPGFGEQKRVKGLVELGEEGKKQLQTSKAFFPFNACSSHPYYDVHKPVLRESSVKPPQKVAKNWHFGLFSHFFCILLPYMCPKTCPNAMKLYPKDNLMFLNTFLIIFRHQNDSFYLSAWRNQYCSPKICNNLMFFWYYFRIFYLNSFNFWTLRDRKNHFDI